MRNVPKNAKVCGHCEAKIETAPTEDEIQAAQQFLHDLPPDLLKELQATFAESATAEEFADRILVGPCPKCGSDETGDCEDDPEIGELLVGRCFQCGQLWCTECDKLLTVKKPECPCWDEEGWDDDDE